ncbi:MAG: hypothetical protein ACFCU5_18645 [Pleurocapsa sp.]
MMLSNLEPVVNSTTNQFIEEISIIIAAQNLTPTMMSQDFLKFSGIIPKEWELTQKPVLNPNFAQLNFQNGLSIVAQPRSITLSESLSQKNLTEVEIATVAVKYIEKLPHAEYVGLSLSPKILIPFPQNPTGVRQYITENLLGSGSWKEIGNFPVQAGVNLMYMLDRCQLTMAISEARIQPPQQSPMPALLFVGNFNYDLERSKGFSSKAQGLIALLDNWQRDINDFRAIVNDKFLVTTQNLQSSISEQTVFPNLTL